MSPFFKEKIYPVIFMAMLTVFCISMVSGLYLATKDKVKANETIVLKKAVLYAADISVPDDNNDIIALYSEKVTEFSNKDGEIEYFAINAGNGSADGYVIFSRGPGLWGEIEAVIGYDKSLSEITGIEFIKQNETPGLGARIMETWFREQFRGKSVPVIMVPEGTATAPDEVDGITGATRTSGFVEAIVNNADKDIIIK